MEVCRSVGLKTPDVSFLQTQRPTDLFDYRSSFIAYAMIVIAQRLIGFHPCGTSDHENGNRE